MKKAFVTGGSRGIGKGIVKKLVQEGYAVAFTYRSKKDEADKLVEEIRGVGGTAYAFAAELEQRGAGVAAFQKAVDLLGGLDLLVNNAGVTKFESVFTFSEETLDQLIDLDFKNYLILMREASNYMKEHGVRGSIVNITSTRSIRAYPSDAVYGGVKAGLNRAIESIALDLAPYGIRVNNVAPGAIRIRTKEELLRDQPEIPADFWDNLGEVIPLKRAGLPEDIAEAVAFFASDKASYITGSTLKVDGGLILPGLPERPDKDGVYRSWTNT